MKYRKLSFQKIATKRLWLRFLIVELGGLSKGRWKVWKY